MIIFLFAFLCMRLSFGTTLLEFINETRTTLESLSPDFEKECTKFITKRYEITDTLTTPQRTVHLSGFCIRTRTLLEYMQIYACYQTETLSLAVYYSRNETVGLTALLLHVNAELDNPKMSGTEIMLLVQHILHGLGVKSCKLRNSAVIRYHLEARSSVRSASIPVIFLRCIRGKTSDWYAEFGYSNGRQSEIEQEMVRIHDTPVTPYHKTAFSPWLYALWNRNDKSAFHIAYQENMWRFSWLYQLRDISTWIAYLHRKSVI